MSSDLKPCPFCGSKRVRSNLYGRECNSDNYGHYVYCGHCAAQGPVITGDAAYFAKGWENARGCRIEHDAAVAYGLEVLYGD
ncbi:Lar family restriction alleviation protein [Parolsenella catena]|uniref:Lar family restriction alleviation protein n=1 Tax=Parolsenella catena TaxID=2003188 RepID=UPI003AEF76AA